MKATPYCYSCLTNLVNQAARLAADGDEKLQGKATEEGMKILEKEFSCRNISIVAAAALHRAIRNITGNADPYREMKDQEIAAARELYRELNAENLDDFRGCLELATKANTIDFFRPIDTIKEDMRKPLHLAIDHSEKLLAMLKSAKRVLYLADNAGEAWLDLPLVKFMGQWAQVTYVVKESPVQNDITPVELERAGIADSFPRVITTGTDTPGVDFAQASKEFKQEFESADLVFAKGMGYWESLSDIPNQGKIFYCLMAKCQPVADSLGVPLNSYVALLR